MILNTVKNIFDSKYRKSILHDKKNLDIEESYHSLSVSSSETNIKANTKSESGETNIKANTKSIIESKSDKTNIEASTKSKSGETNIEASTKSKSGETNIETNIKSESEETNIEASTKSKSGETNIEASTKSKSGETNIETNIKSESEETNIEASTKSESGETYIEASTNTNLSSKPNPDSSIYLEPKETTYSLYGKIIKPTIFKDKIWWIVDINDPSEIQKLNRPGMLGYSAMFLHEPVSNKKNLNNYRFFKLNQIVKVNITYNEKGYIGYMKNTIDMSDKLHLD
jgi:hypothetical protein